MSDDVLPVEVRQYRDDPRFRRFADVLAVPTPRIEVEVLQDQNLSDGKAWVRSARWLEDSKRNYFDAEGSKVLKEVFQRWLAVKSDWRKLVPSPVIYVMALFGSAPFTATNVPVAPPAAEADKAGAQNARQRSTGAVLVNALLLAAIAWYIWTQWPLWKSFIDPEAHDSFKILGLEPGASVTDVKRVYRKLAKTMHPDQGGSNAAYMQMRNAYDELMERERDEHGRPVSLLSDETKEGNLQVLMFIGFVLGRIYEISQFGAEFVLKLINRRDSAAAKVVHSTLHVLCLGLFVIESGVNLNSFILVVTGYNYLSKLLTKYSQPSYIVQQPPPIDDNHLKWEARRYAVVFFLPAFGFHLWKSWGLFGLEWLSRVALGLLFVSCFVMRHRPYIFLQHSLQSRVFNGVNPLFHFHNLLNLVPLPHGPRLIAEVVIDDILAYAMRVPAAFRIACYVMILVSLLQRSIYPALEVLPFSTHAKWNEGMQKMMVQKDSFEKKEEEKASKEAAKKAAAIRTDAKTALTAKEKKELRKQEVHEVQEEKQATRQSVTLIMVVLGSVAAFALLVAVGDSVANGKRLPVSAPTERMLVGVWEALQADRM
eukprot:TRINITY_DN4264_c0_g1_i1.p1 TRINITY_DN4264_c0_g1~~TRINITY_DN4264_c0_g1_i1.p1  ORF type:complete len:596 (+),score=223.25 TRINITY_DN4264_c0_g1_i1:39-1826(+)